MLSASADLTQSQITIVRDLSNGKARTIESHTRPRVADFRCLSQHEIAERIAFPARHRLQDRVSCEVFATWRSIEIDPTSERHARRRLVHQLDSPNQ